MARPRLTVVAVPARDEAERVGACVEALTRQRGLDGAPLPAGAVKVVVLANNCRDRTAETARACGGAVEVLEADLPRASANAGGARRAAMEAAAVRAQTADALICTTDADSRPRPDWIARLWQGLDGGAEAVAGAVDFDPDEAGRLRFSDIRRQESLYSALQAEIIARVDPELHNPWPNHIWAWGANLAVTAAAYRRVGGLPPRPLAEDRAFVEELRRFDVPVRHCLEARVWTSVRRKGRADGGLASLVADHAGDDSAPCDAALEPVQAVLRRTAWRRRLREAYFGRATPTRLASSLRLPLYLIHDALEQPTFGTAWNRVRQTSLRLRSRRLNPLELRREISRAERLLRRIAPADPVGRARAASAGLWSAPQPCP
jgi:glycosyltransferase involved in cell wall biosynthesis